MDFTKLLGNLRSQAKGRSGSAPGESSAHQFLAQLFLIIDQDLKLLSRCSAPDEALSFSGVRVDRGTFERQGTRTMRPLDGVSEYVFLQIPSSPGFLVQRVGPERLSLERATRARPQVVDFTGSVVSRTLFVSQKGSLEELAVLDENTVRTSNGRTLSAAQFSEMLISLAFEQIESNLADWVRN